MPGTKRLATRRDDNNARSRILAGFCERSQQRVQHFLTQRIELLRSIERQRTSAVVQRVQQVRLGADRGGGSVHDKIPCERRKQRDRAACTLVKSILRPYHPMLCCSAT